METAQPTSAITPTLTFTGTPTRAALQFEYLGIPGSYSENEFHWPIYDLHAWGDRVYIGHGDWDLNTGPVRALYLDTVTQRTVHDRGFVFDDEAIWRFRSLGDILMAVGIDARESFAFGNLYARSTSEGWTKIRALPGGVHVWDVGVLNGTLFASGSSERTTGLIWTSSDQGKMWRRVLEFDPPGSAPSGAMRALGTLFTLGGRLHLATVRNGCYVIDGTIWPRVDCWVYSVGGQFPWRAEVYDGVALFGPSPRSIGGPSGLATFDGTTRSVISFRGSVRDLLVTNGTLYVLLGFPNGDGEIIRSAALHCRCTEDFVSLGEFRLTEGKRSHPKGNGPLSLELSGGKLLVGMSDGRLFASRDSVPLRGQPGSFKAE